MASTSATTPARANTHLHPNTRPITGSEIPASVLARGTDACFAPNPRPCRARSTPSKMVRFDATWIIPLAMPPAAVAMGMSHQVVAVPAITQEATTRYPPMRRPRPGPIRPISLPAGLAVMAAAPK